MVVRFQLSHFSILCFDIIRGGGRVPLQCQCYYVIFLQRPPPTPPRAGVKKNTKRKQQMATSKEVAAMLGSGWDGEQNPLQVPKPAPRRASFGGFLPMPNLPLRRASIAPHFMNDDDGSNSPSSRRSSMTIAMRRSSLGPGVAIGRVLNQSPKGSLTFKRSSTGSQSLTSIRSKEPQVRVETTLFADEETESVGTSEGSDSPTATPREGPQTPLYILWQSVSSSCGGSSGILDYNTAGVSKLLFYPFTKTRKKKNYFFFFF